MKSENSKDQTKSNLKASFFLGLMQNDDETIYLILSSVGVMKMACWPFS